MPDEAVAPTAAPSDRRFLPRLGFPCWLGEARASELLSYALSNEARFVPAQIEGNGVSLRTDPCVRASVKLDDLGTHGSFIEDRVRQMLPVLEAGLGRLAGPPKALTVEMVAHGHGAHFLSHIDTITGPGALARKGRRRFSLVYYLHRQPVGFTGGSLRFYSLREDAWQDVAPEHDTMVAFPSWARHSVERVEVPSGSFADSRFAINVWVYD